MKSHRRGQLVAIEGIDGCGKSSLSVSLFDVLQENGYPVVLVNRRTIVQLATGYSGSHLSALSRLIWDYPQGARTSDLGFMHWAKLLGAWYSALDHVVVQPALDAGITIIADSWFYKYAARFSLATGLTRSVDWFDDISIPDHVVWLDIAPEICAERRAYLRSTERGEWVGPTEASTSFVEYQSKVRERLSKFASSGSWYIVNSVEPPEVVAQRIYVNLIDALR